MRPVSEPGASRPLDAPYPFLAETSSATDVRADMARSTRDKVAEIVELRRSVLTAWADQLAACGAAVARSGRGGGTVFTFGNGGSSTDANALASCFLLPVRGTPMAARALTTDAALLTALANDVGIEVVFARQVAAFAKAGDVAVGLSTSGGSANVLRGLEEAGRRNLVTVGFAGYEGGAMADAGLDFCFVVPSASVHRIQEAQTTLYHVLWEAAQARLG